MDLCYFCGKIANSREHIPPKQVFKGFSINRITVPSCNEHNTQKCGEDEAIIKSMLLSIARNNNIILTSELLKALNEVKNYYKQVKKTVTEDKIYLDCDKNVVCLDKNINLNYWIKELSAGMIWYKIKYFDADNKYIESKVFERNSYSNNKRYLIDFEKERNEKIKLQTLSEIGLWNDGWIPKVYPENLYLFKYKFIKSTILMKHIFYKCFVYYNLIEISNETKNKLL
jgi:hypothetical protein